MRDLIDDMLDQWMTWFVAGWIIYFVCAGCGLLTNNLPGVAEDLLNEGYTSVHCDPNKVLNPQLAGCDDEDQIAIECAARTVEGESVVITVCSEIKVDR
jgi:hypothetical protein